MTNKLKVILMLITLQKREQRDVNAVTQKVVREWFRKQRGENVDAVTECLLVMTATPNTAN